MIYETSGRAREYFELAANLYSGCEHACAYCFGPAVTHKDPKQYFENPQARDKVLHQLKKDAARLPATEIRHILLSFVTDPYQPLEEELKITRGAIQILHAEELYVAILTKGGMLATRDFDLLTKLDLFGVSLTFMYSQSSHKWEPGAAPPVQRIESLKEAHERGISTWVSLEPVIDYRQTLAPIEATAKFVDVFKVGTLNYSGKLPRDLVPPPTDWKVFAQEAVKLLDRLGANYYIKKELARHIGRPEGIRKGHLPQ